MESLIIRNDGIFIRELNKNLKVVELVPIVDLSFHYLDYLELDKDLTFGGLFSVLEPHLFKLEDHFMAETRRWPLKPFFDMVKNDITEDLKFTEIQFSWNYQYFEYLDRKTNKTEKSLENYVHLCALGESDEHGIMNYSLSFIELNNIKNVLVKIIKDCQIYGTDHKTPILEFEKEMNLREFLGGLLNEITFYGSPEKMKDQLAVLEERCQGSYDESDLIPFENVQMEWLEEELNEALLEEDYEWAERVRLEIERIKKNDGMDS